MKQGLWQLNIKQWRDRGELGPKLRLLPEHLTPLRWRQRLKYDIKTKGGNAENATLDLFSRTVTRCLTLIHSSPTWKSVDWARISSVKSAPIIRFLRPIRLTGFEAGLVDFNLSSDRLLVFQVRKILHLGAGARGGTGVAVGEALPRTVRPPALAVVEHGHQLEETNAV